MDRMRGGRTGFGAGFAVVDLTWNEEAGVWRAVRADLVKMNGEKPAGMPGGGR